MKEKGIEKRKVESLAKSLGFGFYWVNKEGQFLECNPRAREIFGLSKNQEDLSMYSIKDFYVVPAERERRLKKLIKEKKCGPSSGTLSMRIKGENKLLFDIGWCAAPHLGGEDFYSLIAEIENNTIFPKMFETFPLGLFELNEEGIVLRMNKQLLKILKYEDEQKILNHPYRDFCEDHEVIDNFVKEIDKKGFAYQILRIRDAENNIIEVECFAQNINEYGRARWGMLNDVTERLSYTRAVEMMPTGYYRIEHPIKNKNRKLEQITLCNELFAQIFGFGKKENAIGKNIVDTVHLDKATGDEFFKHLHQTDSKGEALLNYPFIAKRHDNGEIIHVSLDVHLLKDSKGNVFGREGTARDMTAEVELQNRIKEVEERIRKTTEDINSFVHTFLHPVVQFAGDSELLHQVGNALFLSMKQEMTPSPEKQGDVKKLGKELINKLIELRDIIPDTGEVIHKIIIDDKDASKIRQKIFTMGELRDRLTTIINTFDYSLEEVDSLILLEGDLRITALLVLEELNKLGGRSNEKLKLRIKQDFIEFLQRILFDYLTQTAGALQGETESMKKGVETLRDHIILRDKKYRFHRQDIGQILENSIKTLRPAFLEKKIDIELKKGTGDLSATVSRNEFDRVITNLLYNARKYTFPKEGRYISINVRELGPLNAVELSITNFGVPIKAEEIESGAIWEFGFRGKLAYLHDREGTGVGLADAKEVIEAHGGNIWLTSFSKSDQSPPRYKVPYKTTVTIRIPSNQDGNGKE